MAATPEKPMHPIHTASMKETAGKQANAAASLAKCAKGKGK